MARTGVAIKNLGCRVNRVEADVIASRLEEAGVPIVDEQDAAAIIINTCAVTGEAEAKTRKAIRHAAALGQKPLVIACGCVVNLFASEIEGIAPNVRVEKDKGRVAALAAEEFFSRGNSPCEARELAKTPTPTGRTRPGIKVQDGCDNRCSFCLVWKARGRAVSQPLDSVLREVDAAVARGARELVLTGINVGTYNVAGPGGSIGLPQLIEHVLERPGVGRVRIASIEPPDVTEELIDVFARSGERVAPFLHVCLQSGCDETLARMRRNYRTAEFRERIELAKQKISGLALGTDIIVGFPKESDDEFEQSLAFCEEMGFSRMHVFRYSKRAGTPAATMDGQVPAHVMALRAQRMHELAGRMRHEHAAGLVGSEQLVVVQEPGKGVTGGLFDVVLDKSLPPDTLVHAHISSADAKGLLYSDAYRL